jgi:hypothetical protein
MWYRIRYRHYRNIYPEQLQRFWVEACANGQIDPKMRLSEAFQPLPPSKVQAITVCTIERKITDSLSGFVGEVSAWARIARGFAFCSHRDSFCRYEGRKQALKRAFSLLPDEQLEIGQLKSLLDSEITKHTKPNEVFHERER